jgi:hypothetical protein
MYDATQTAHHMLVGERLGLVVDQPGIVKFHSQPFSVTYCFWSQGR